MRQKQGNFSRNLPRLPALELFAGFDSDEIALLEGSILYFVQECLRGFISESKITAPGNKASFNEAAAASRRSSRENFASYVFPGSSDTLSFGRNSGITRDAPPVSESSKTQKMYGVRTSENEQASLAEPLQHFPQVAKTAENAAKINNFDVNSAIKSATSIYVTPSGHRTIKNPIQLFLNVVQRCANLLTAFESSDAPLSLN